jgi:hypothetical protein
LYSCRILRNDDDACDETLEGDAVEEASLDFVSNDSVLTGPFLFNPLPSGRATTSRAEENNTRRAVRNFRSRWFLPFSTLQIILLGAVLRENAVCVTREIPSKTETDFQCEML